MWWGFLLWVSFREPSYSLLLMGLPPPPQPTPSKGGPSRANTAGPARRRPVRPVRRAEAVVGRVAGPRQGARVVPGGIQHRRRVPVMPRRPFALLNVGVLDRHSLVGLPERVPDLVQ